MPDTINISEHLKAVSKEEMDFYNRALTKALCMFLKENKGVIVKVHDPFFPTNTTVAIYRKEKMIKFKIMKSTVEDLSHVTVHEDEEDMDFEDDSIFED